MATQTALAIRKATKPGKCGDGQGLYLNVARGGSKSWIQRITIDGKRKEIGLGGFPAVSLAKARELSMGNRAAVADFPLKTVAGFPLPRNPHKASGGQ